MLGAPGVGLFEGFDDGGELSERGGEVLEDLAGDDGGW